MGGDNEDTNTIQLPDPTKSMFENFFIYVKSEKNILVIFID